MPEPVIPEYVICMYIRLSSEDDDIKYNDAKNESNSITAQRKMLYDYIGSRIEFRDCKVIERCDDGFSGTHFDTRPQFIDMIEMAKRGEINCIIVKDFSRFGRDYIELGDYMEQFFPTLGIRFISVNDNYDSDLLSDGELGGIDVSFKNLIYDYYARETSKKEKLSWKKSAERGEYRASVPLYGYKKSKDNNLKLEIDPEAARVVKEIFEMKLSGMTLTEIASNLNDRNVLPPKEYKYKSGDKRAINKNIRKTYWESGVVEAILKNEKYTGDMVLLKTFNNRITGKQEKRASDEWVTVENTHEPIVSREEFNAVANTFARIKRTRKSKINVFYCSVCGRKMYKTKGALLKCRINSVVSDDIKCVSTTMNVAQAEKAVLADIKMKCMVFLNMHEVARDMNITQQKTLDEQIQSVENTLTNIENAWKNIYSEYADRKISKEDYLEKTKEYKGKKQSLATELTHLMAKKEQSVSENKAADVVELLIKKFCDADTLTEEMKELLIEKILVYSNNVLEIYWKADFIKYFSDTSRIIGKETGKNE